jgi:uncharacterized protein (TIGR03435 family)
MIHRRASAVALSVCACVLAFASAGWGQIVIEEQEGGAPPAVGDAAPELSADGVLDGALGGDGDSPGLERFRGRAVVLEFSAGWCGPCRAMVPHMNEVYSAFRDSKDVAFLAVTNEGKQAAEAFRSGTGMQMPLAYDADGSTYESYWIEGVPHVFLIDREGKIAAAGHPAFITPKAIGALIKGEPVVLEDGGDAGGEREPVRVDWDMGGMAFDPESMSAMLAADAAQSEALGPAVAYAVLRPAEKFRKFSIGREGAKDIREKGTSARHLVSVCYGFDDQHIEDLAGLPERDAFDLECRAADDTLESARRLGRALLESTFGFEAREEEAPAKVWLLRRVAGGAEPARAGAPDGESHSIMPGDIDAPAATAAEFAGFIGWIFPEPVIDETGLEGRYDFRLRWDLTAEPDSPEGLHRALRESGFELVEGERPVRRLVLEPRG